MTGTRGVQPAGRGLDRVFPRRRSAARADAGFNAYVSKPVEPERLVQVVADTARSAPANQAHTPAAIGPASRYAVEVRERARPAWRSRGPAVPEQPDGPPFYRHLSFRRGHASQRVPRRRRGRHRAGRTGRADGDHVLLHCACVQKPFTTDDTRRDDRLRQHPGRDAVRSYCGVLLRRPDGTAFGTLCHFDVVACDVPGPEVALMEAAAGRIMRIVLPISGDPPDESSRE